LITVVFGGVGLKAVNEYAIERCAKKREVGLKTRLYAAASTTGRRDRWAGTRPR
jgi:hypothetical protein